MAAKKTDRVSAELVEISAPQEVRERMQARGGRWRGGWPPGFNDLETSRHH